VFFFKFLKIQLSEILVIFTNNKTKHKWKGIYNGIYILFQRVTSAEIKSE
jgi:hypothetical protein